MFTCGMVKRLGVGKTKGLISLFILEKLKLICRTKRLGCVLKMLIVLFLFLPLVLWPVVCVVGSLLGGIGYGFFAPLIATFEVIGTDREDKCFHCFVVSTIHKFVYFLFSVFWCYNSMILNLGWLLFHT